VSKVPSLSYTKIIAAFERDGWVRVRQRGSHIRLEKKVSAEKTLKITVLVCQVEIDGYNFVNLMRASSVVNCQLTGEEV
jgi:predicted RNA binding protein YcfA (HicA-like mRNA interferase family)